MTKTKSIAEIVELIGNKDKKIRYLALEEINNISKSRETNQKAELLKILNE